MLGGANNFNAALKQAAMDPMTYLPLAGAAIYSIEDEWDQETSDWAVDNNPVFGSNNRAKTFSDIMLYGILAPQTVVTASLRDDHEPDLPHHALGYDLAGAAASWATVQSMKNRVGRNRPCADNDDDCSGDNNSFPSGHSSHSRYLAVVSNENLRVLHEANELSSRTYNALRYANGIGAFATAWARVEGEKHYPRDILVGMAIGNFFAVVTNELMKSEANLARTAAVDLQPIPGGAYITLSASF